MEPSFYNGDLVLIRRQSDLEDGQLAAVLIDGEAALRHVYHQSDGILLVAGNAKYTPIFLEKTDCDDKIIQGKAVGLVRMFIDAE